MLLHKQGCTGPSCFNCSNGSKDSRKQCIPAETHQSQQRYDKRVFNADLRKDICRCRLTEARARQEGFTINVGEFTTMDRHPGSPEQARYRSSLSSKCSGVILGAQISGGDSVGEMINIASLAIQKGMTATELNTFQVATHPLLSASPIAYPINAASYERYRTELQAPQRGLNLKVPLYFVLY